LLKSGTPGAEAKYFLEDALRIIATVAPLLKTGETASANKDFLGNALRVITTIAPLLKVGHKLARPSETKAAVTSEGSLVAA
jgi:hypothetical protein